MSKDGGGGKAKILVVLLAVMVGGGSWNYQRNLAAEAADPRPYKSYSIEQLDQLLAAYEEEAGALNQRYEMASGQRTRSRDTQLLGEAVDEFQRVQRSSRAVRDLGSRLSQEMASVQAIRKEKALRIQLGGPVTTFLRRAFLPPA